MSFETIYGIRILYNEKIFCTIIFRKDIDKENILSIIDDIFLNLQKNTFTFEVLVKNEIMKTWNLFESYIWNKISSSKFNNFISNKKEFVIEHFE